MMNATEPGIQKKNVCGLVICGGESLRMGTDKSLLNYFGKPQRYRLSDMLGKYCDRVIISCNQSQASSMQDGYEYMIDDPEFDNNGPLTGLLTAIKNLPGADFLVVGCDYPFLDEKDFAEFLSFAQDHEGPAAFYNEFDNVYEPVLAYYPQQSGIELFSLFTEGDISLQHYLQLKKATKYLPANKIALRSVDTQRDFEAAMLAINLY